MSKSNIAPALLIALAIVILPIIMMLLPIYIAKNHPEWSQVMHFGSYNNPMGRQAKEIVETREKLVISDVQFIKGDQSDSLPKLIGTLTNNSDKLLNYIQFQLILRDADGKLLDVSSEGYMALSDVLEPGKEAVFSFDLYGMNPEWIEAIGTDAGVKEELRIGRLQVVE